MYHIFKSTATIIASNKYVAVNPTIPQSKITTNILKIATKNVEQNVRQEIRKKIWDDVCRGWKLKFPSDEERIACDMLEILKKGENITQKELAQKRNTTVYKVQAVQRKLKSIGVIKYIGRGRNGYWKLADSTPL